MYSDEKEILAKEREWNILSDTDFESVRKDLEEVYYERKCEEMEEEAFDYIEEGNLENALANFTEILKYQGTSLRNWLNLGYVLSLQNKMEEARDAFEKSIFLAKEKLKSHPTSSHSYYDLAGAHSLLKNKEKMLQFLNKALELNKRLKSSIKRDEFFKFYNKNSDFLNLLNDF